MGKNLRKKKLKDPDLYFNRELSWLEFNDRVLGEGLNETVPLLERLKFLAIVSSNLDEFFMVRVAGLYQQHRAQLRRRDPSGLTPLGQLDRISERVHRMVAEQTQAIQSVLTQLAGKGLRVLEPAAWSAEQRQLLRRYFTAEILPILTPLALPDLHPDPLLPGLQLHLAALLDSDKTEQTSPPIVVVPVPSLLPRFIQIPSAGPGQLARLEDVLAANLDRVFARRKVRAATVFRLTRDADIAIQDDEAGDLLEMMEQVVLDRRRQCPVRLEIGRPSDARIQGWLVDWLGLRAEDVYEIDGMLDATGLFELAGRPGLEGLKDPEWPAQPARDLVGCEDLWQALQDHDVLLSHPYESFDPVVRMVRQAAEDPDVLAIKQTLYRTSGDSPIIQALEHAAQLGKQVTVLVELRARFDEARNVQWARRLEDAGCLVIYGIAGYKTHSKALLIVRRESGRLQRYVHLATGNYNDKTARLYSDVGLMTADRDITNDVAGFFNLLTGYSEAVGWSELTIAPTDLRRRFLELIDREVQTSTAEQRGLILAKVNSLQDPKIIEALYRAAAAGVDIRLNVRGICCLRPGVKGVSQRIEVVSIVDRYLEHARIFYFRNGGHEEYYLGSADWMTRNLDKRLELLFPVKDPNLRRRLQYFLETYFADNVKARRLLPDGRYEPIASEGPAVRAQEELYRDAVKAAQAAQAATMRFRPLRRPAAE
ncbi:MAG: polyphosphate kinase 1 [Sedimentisphaerales bacterium]|nr:polyphosphate kinase 1 [Sedimentisphaerales bacterium]